MRDPVLAVEPNLHLAWPGHLWLPGLFDGEHHFRIEVIDAHQVRLVQEESFSGLFLPFVSFQPYRRGWQRMNQALKLRAEVAETTPSR